jgi:hypothetical protein
LFDLFNSRLGNWGQIETFDVHLTSFVRPRISALRVTFDSESFRELMSSIRAFPLHLVFFESDLVICLFSNECCAKSRKRNPLMSDV